MKTIKILGSIALFVLLSIFLNSPVYSQHHGKHCPMHASCSDSGAMHFGKMPELFDHCYPWKKNHSDKFKGHWAGIELGFNGYVDNNFSMDLPADMRFLELNTARSMQFSFNPFELNLNLAKNHLGFVTGLGLTFNNYFFENKNYYIVPNEPEINAYLITDRDGKSVDMNKSKLTVVWLNLPILFEYQTNNRMKANSFHVAAGVIASARIWQHTKIYYPGINTTYYLNDQEGNPTGTITSPDYKAHDNSQFHLNPFKIDGTMRIGWSFLNFWGTYSFTTLFKENQGPELFPYSVGITLAGW